MTAAGWLQLLALIVLLAVSVPVLGNYMAKVFGGRRPRAIASSARSSG